MLEPYDGKLSRTVLGGEWSRKAPDLPGAPSKYEKIFRHIYHRSILLDKWGWGLLPAYPTYNPGGGTAQIYSPIVFNTGFLVAGCGLIWRKGWGRNFALFFNGISILVGLRHLLTYFYGESSEIVSIFKGLSDFLIAGLIYFYLFKDKIKTLFPKSPVSWCILGLFLLLYSLNQDTGNVIIDTFWTILTIVGLAISGYGAKQLRESTPQNPIFMNKDI